MSEARTTYLHKIEVTQLIISILISNYGEIMIYLLIGNTQDAFEDLKQPPWALSYLPYTIVTFIAYTCMGYASFLVLSFGSVEGKLTGKYYSTIGKKMFT